MKVYYNVLGLRRGFDSSGRELLEWELLAKRSVQFISINREYYKNLTKTITL